MLVRRMLASVAVACSMALVPGVQAQSFCPGDATNDGQVNSVDIAQVLADWGACSSCLGDVNDDGQVNASDLAEVLAGWGACRPVILAITPNVGHISGGTLVTISGAYFSSASSIEFGGVPGTGLTVLNSSTLTVSTPPNAVGSTAVRVTTSAGSAVSKGGFSYIGIIVPTWAALIEATPDPVVVTDDALRAAIIATGYAWRVRHTQTQIEMLLVPPGTFNMGCSPSILRECFDSESPIHAVTLTSAFYLGRYEVTQAQWTSIAGSNPSNYINPSADVPAALVPLRPVERVSWDMIQDFNIATGLRLPTEAEWEYAYRAGTTTAFHSFSSHPAGTNEDALLGSIAWFSGNRGQPGSDSDTPKPVGQKLANALGLHDMSGNVAEWLSDVFLPDYYSNSPPSDPSGPRGDGVRVLRGGAWVSDSVNCRSSDRLYFSQDHQFEGFGFRVARNP
jgi:formylglycine-generating enzyme required for sulfatase activity